ncbi:DUF4974 domain-containing protein [Chitinophaga agrisoli]|uniref:DUF4974 domain-containing protein n=1 Tax=Chitinophaga agrisoli TaxID=2607653 RepID=A0A5B2VRF2_9BACT|nr:FecR domain-containing protein [Chitinophaga agrisoli]KAA2240719.1 DUF4974 domain-containing protein [Chitinophaga agrisoli]
MDLNGFEKVVQRYLNGQATDDDLLLIEEWLRRTEGNDYQLTEERKKMVAARLLPRLHAITHPQEVPQTKGLLRHLSKRVVRIAAASIILTLTGSLGWLFRYQLADTISPVALKTIKAGPYEIKKIALPDHTLVTLNTGASISFPVRYRGHNRTATVSGEAYFEVTKDQDKPFIVHTSSLDVTVLGTSFVIGEQRAFATVSVITGRVRVAADEQQLAELQPGLQVRYDKQSGKANLLRIDVQQVTAWTQHSLSFQEAPLEQVLTTIAKQWNVRMILPPVPSGKEFSGDFTSNDSLDDMMSALALATGIKWKQTTAGVISIAYP